MSPRISHQGTKTQRNTKSSVGAHLRVRPFLFSSTLPALSTSQPPVTPWELIQERLEKDYKVYLLVDNIPVTLSLAVSFEDYTLHIRPQINGHYVPDFVEPIWQFEAYQVGMNEILDRFYYRRQHVTEDGKKNKKLKRKGKFDVIIYYSSFQNFKAFKKHYQENFDEIIILDAPIEPAPGSLPADLSQALLQPQTKALNPGAPRTITDTHGGKDEL